MKKLLLAALLPAAALAQPAGTVVKTSTTNIVATIGSLVCTFTSSVPQSATGIKISCDNGAGTKLSQDVTLAAGAVGAVGSLTLTAQNYCTWQLKLETNGTVSYQIAVPGKLDQGVM